MTLLKRCSVFFMAALLLSALGCTSTPTRESTAEYLDDTAVTARVKTAIFNEPTLKVLQINVETYKNVVQLSGFVNNGADMNKAVDVARGVKGVVSVKNDLRLK